MIAITVCVDYAKFLSQTLPYNRHHFSEWIIITASKDEATIQLAKENDASCIITDAFYRDGADFNKYLALEEGLKLVHNAFEWVCILDADIFWPRMIDFKPKLGKLYTPYRMMSQTFKPEPWTHPNIDKDWNGYCQIFHPHDRALGPAPWHETNWKHAGGGDTMFQNKWHPQDKVRPPFIVLHIGEPRVNWCGVGNKDKLEKYMKLRAKNKNFEAEKL
jgi:hypothetical protein